MCMCIGIHMGSKNISITEDVYNRLMRIKGENESFSELFLKLLKMQKIHMENFFGLWDLSKEEKHDIWDDICLDNLETMATLHRKYGRRCDWQGSWKRDWLKYQQRREREQDRMWRY